MTTATESHVADASHAADHPSDLKYIKIAALLAVLTMIEVLTYTFGLEGATLKLVILPIMVVKFAIVAGYFMHLKFDSKVYTAMFCAGLAFAVVLYVVVLTVFRYW
ncbi:MAG: cytochrome C oxidase subunit IV family protein [Solirubrobacterales bacterium]|nr:cytochrome C oxidase subunit IV family protein [Solirubrobacterales bacterium]